jgi:hypothetical protein
LPLFVTPAKITADAVDEFQAETFRHSAPAACDMADFAFSYHDSGAQKPALCAAVSPARADRSTYRTENTPCLNCRMITAAG